MNDLSVEIEVKQIVYLNISSSFLFHHLSAISFSSFPSFSSLFSSRSYFILFRFSLPLSSPFSTYCSFSPFLYVPLDFFFFFFLSIFCASSFVSSLPLSHFLLLLLLSLLFLFFINSLPSLHFSPRLNHPPSPLSLSFRVLTPLSSTFIPPFLRCFIFLLNFI